jgi:Flp pilus assembly protein TadG
MKLNKTTNRIQPSNRRRFRCGSHTVEFAMVVPIIFTLFLGSIEITRLNFIRHTVANAAYEGARAAIVPGATENDAISEARRLLTSMGCGVDANVTAVVNSTTVQVFVSVPVDANSWGLGRFTSGLHISRTSRLSKEFQ